MACMEHQCDTCGEMWFDNKASGTCSKCGSYDVASFFDEAEVEIDHQEDLIDWWLLREE